MQSKTRRPSPRAKAVFIIVSCFITPALLLLPLNFRPSTVIDLNVVTDRILGTAGNPPELGGTDVPLVGNVNASAIQLSIPSATALDLPDGTLAGDDGQR